MIRFRTLAAAAVALVLAGTSVYAAVAHNLTGRWMLSVVTDNGTGYPVLDLKQDGDRITGSYTSNAMGSRTIQGSVRGDTLTFALSASGMGEGVVLTYAAHIVTPDSLNGFVDFAGQGGASFTGRREK